MELARRDADFGAEAIAEAIGEARRAVAVDAGRIDPLLEVGCRRIICGDNRVGMVRAPAVDVGNRLLDAVHNLAAHHIVAVLGPILILAHRLDLRNV